MKSMKQSIVALTLVGLLGVFGCGSGEKSTAESGAPSETAAPAITLNGAGSTFVNPAMSKWAYEYNKANPSITINYQSVGSGAGISQYQAGTVDFGATDAPVPDKDLATMPTPTLHIPVVSGAVVITYNVPGVTADLKFSPETLAGIFLGKIKTWNDPKIAADNARVSLPDKPIAVCHRSDGSGTSYIFTNYLSAVSADWKAGPGAGKSVDWPAGTGAKGNDGVAGLVKQTEGGIGYVELAFAIQGKLPYADVKNAAGKFVKPSIESVTAAEAGSVEALKKDVRAPIVNATGADAYPICGFTYVLVSKTPKDAAKSKALLDFLNWALDAGQGQIADLQYAPLPKEVVDLNKQALSEVQSAAK